MAPRSDRHHAPQLSRRRLGVSDLVFFTVAASAPLTVLGGGVTTTFAITGIPTVSLAFVLLAVALGLFAVGYAAMSRYVANAGAFYSYLSQGLGRVMGVGGAFVAIVSYTAIYCGLYGLMGASLGDFFAVFGLEAPWWVWGLVTVAVVGALGVLRIDLNAKVLAVVLTLEVITVLIYDIGAFGNSAGPGSFAASFDPSQLFVAGAGGVFALCIAAFIGFESGAIYSEETRDPGRTVGRATFIALGFIGVFYAISAWAMVHTVGAANVQAAATEAGPGLVFGALAEQWSPVVADIANILFLTSVFAALLSFHNSVSRYLFALGRERVLPSALGTVSSRSGSPVAGSAVVSAVAVVVLLVFALTGGDPVLELFTWFSGMSAIGVVLLMTLTAAAVIGFFRDDARGVGVFSRLVAPAIAVVALGAVFLIVVGNFDSMLGTEPDSPLRWILPGIVLLAGVLGAVWGLYLRSSRPEVYEGIGHIALAPDEEDEDDAPVLPPAPAPYR